MVSRNFARWSAGRSGPRWTVGREGAGQQARAQSCEKVSSSPAPDRTDKAHTGPTDGLAGHLHTELNASNASNTTSAPPWARTRRAVRRASIHSVRIRCEYKLRRERDLG